MKEKLGGAIPIKITNLLSCLPENYETRESYPPVPTNLGGDLLPSLKCFKNGIVLEITNLIYWYEFGNHSPNL